MGKPDWVKPNHLSRKRRTRTRGSKTFQYPEENKLTCPPNFITEHRLCEGAILKINLSCIFTFYFSDKVGRVNIPLVAASETGEAQTEHLTKVRCNLQPTTYNRQLNANASCC